MYVRFWHVLSVLGGYPTVALLKPGISSVSYIPGICYAKGCEEDQRA